MRKPHLKKRKKFQTKERKKFQNYFAEVYTDHLPIYELLWLCRKQLNKKLKKLSDAELIEEIRDKMLGNYCVGQWREFKEFEKYVEGKQ